MNHLSRLIPSAGLLVMAALGIASYKTVHYRVNNPGRWKVDLAYPVFNGSDALSKFATQMCTNEIHEAKGFVKESTEFQKGQPKPEEPYPFTEKFKVVLERPDLIVVDFSADIYLGGAHGSQADRFYCFGYVHGQPKRLKLQDLFKSGVDARQIMSKIVVEHLKKNQDAAWIQDGTVKDLSAMNAEQFGITKTGISFLFNPYEMGPYSSGSIGTLVSWSEIRSYLDPSGPLRGLMNSR